jgi:hypothetical protein
LGEREVGDITDGDVNETDEWRWTVEHLNHLPGLDCNGERAQERAHGSYQSCFHTAFLR